MLNEHLLNAVDVRTTIRAWVGTKVHLQQMIFGKTSLVFESRELHAHDLGCCSLPCSRPSSTNATTAVLLTPVTVSIARILKVSPFPYLVSFIRGQAPPSPLLYSQARLHRSDPDSAD